MEISQLAVTAIVGLGGATIGFIGGLIGLWDARKRWAITLESDRKVKRDDREVAMRRDAYSSVMENLTKFDTYLARRLIADDPAGPEFMRPQDDLLASISKASVFAGTTTIDAGRKLLDFQAEHLRQLLVLLGPLHEIDTDLKLRNDHMREIQTEMSRLMTLISQLADDGIQDSAKFRRLTDRYEFHSMRANELRKEINALLVRQLPALKTYLDAVVEFARLQDPLREDLRLSMQNDLGLPPSRESDAAQARRDAAIHSYQKFSADHLAAARRNLTDDIYNLPK